MYIVWVLGKSGAVWKYTPNLIYSDLAQIAQVHSIKYLQILIVEFQLYKLSLRES